ncbi:MAG: M81 family metallopeptidase [Oscillospiraceae bacterium]|nr:M81 family metallopeptidase [Oscillospiraceae bacterium]
MKVLIGHFGHEANTFAQNKTSYEDFIGRGIFIGEDSVRMYEGTAVYLGGIIRACREEDIDIIPTCAYTCAAPTLTEDCVDKMLAHILPVAQTHRNEIDGICMALHGAGVSEEHDDLESYVLTRLRQIVGDAIPITVCLDLHGNITQDMANLSNGLFGIRKYPHTDKDAAGYLAMKTLARIMKENIQVETVVERLPLLVPISAGLTANPPFPEMEAYFEEYTKKHGLIHASFFHGFPYADVPGSGASVVVAAQQGRDAKKAARHLAEFVWERRHFFEIQVLSPAKAMDLAQQETAPGCIVINEMSDNPGGGCPGDGTHLLREMLKRNLPGSIFGYMVDPAAVDELFRYKPGDKVSFWLGGRHEKIFGDPLFIRDAELIALSSGNFVHTSPNLRGAAGKLGNCARVKAGNVEIVIGSVRNQTFDDRPFAVTGADLREYRYVGLKSTQHFRAYFSCVACRIVSTDPPGLNSGDLSVFIYQKTPRPIFPLDEDVVF